MKKQRSVVAAGLLAATISSPVTAFAGPGLGNVAYTQAEYQTAVSLFNASNMPNGPAGADTVFMIHGYLVVLGTYDSGKANGAFHIFDVSDPRKPVLLKTYTSPLTAKLAEWHMAGMSRVAGKDIVVTRTTTGIAFFDFTDALNPKDFSQQDLPGVNGGDYTNSAWMNSWSWPYVYTGNSGAGFSVTDATDPANPKLVKQTPTGKTGNFRVGPVYAAGNSLIITNMDEAPFRASVLDVSDPMSPALVATVTAPNDMYSSLVIGDMLFGGGDKSNYTFLKWTESSIKVVTSVVIGSDKGAYCTYQDGFGICGESANGYHKINLSDYANPKVVGQGVLTQQEAEGGDFDFATTLGNLVFQGNDHGSGNGLIVHQMAPDTTPPAVVKIYPEDLATKQPLSSHVTIFFSDEIDTDTMDDKGIVVRKVGGSPLSGVYSHSSTNAVSFGPMQPLETNTTYEISVVAGGIKDLVGNALAVPVTARFSTGAVVTGGTNTDGGGSPVNGAAGAGGSNTGTGGNGSGGAVATGGSSSGTAGDAAAGGSPAGGAPGFGGAGVAGSNASGDQQSKNSSGCACSVKNDSKRSSLTWLLAMGLAWGARRRRSRRTPTR